MKRKNKELNFDLKQLRSYLEVLNENSFTRASRKLKIGQATISHHIQSLEEMLGVKLINRTSKEFFVTAEGELFKSYCLKIFDDITGLMNNLARGVLGGTTRVAASTIPSTYIIPRVISRLRKRYPEIYYHMETSDSREAVEMVKEGKAEIGIVGREFKHASLIYKTLCNDEIVLIGPAEYPDRVAISELTEFPFVIREFGSGTRNIYEGELARHDILPSMINAVMECTSTEGVKESVAAGVGVSFVSRRAIVRELKLGELKILDVNGLKINRDFFITHLKKRQLSRSAEIFIEALLEIKG